MKKTIGIYCIKNKKSNKIYIGQSINCEERIKDHFRKLKNGKHENPYLQKSYFKNGLDSFFSEILEECSFDVINEREVFYIEKFDSLCPAGYNIEKGGKNGRRFTEEMKKRHSEIRIGKKLSGKYVGVRNKNNGWEASISIDMKQIYIGRYATEEDAGLAYDKMSLEVYGKTFNFDYNYVVDSKLPEKVKTSSYIGVTKRVDTRRGRNKISWRARVQIDKKMISIGDFEKEIDAAIARDEYILENNIKAKLNFGNKNE